MAATAIDTQIDILDLRHFTAAQLRPLLRDEARRWHLRLHWDYTSASNLLLDYIDGRILAGYVALDAPTQRILGYAFFVFENDKAVLGDIYAFDETEALRNPLCERLLTHCLETLRATPGVDRIESQLLMFPAGALANPFLRHGFRSLPRLFMSCGLTPHLGTTTNPDAPRPALSLSKGLASETWDRNTLTLHPWQPTFYEPAAALIHRCYTGHMDAQINDQYQTLAGAQRFLHNIIRFPGCGTFDAEDSLVLRDTRTGRLLGLVLCSRIRADVAHITQICVTPERRGQGLGESLLRDCMEHLAKRGVAQLSLTVTEANTGALRLYERNGFTTMHRFEAMVWEKSSR